MVIDFQSLLAGLTIATGIFLAGRFLGKLEERLLRKNEVENDCNQQLKRLNAKINKHLLGPTSEGSDGED